MSETDAKSPVKSPHAKSPVTKRPRVNTEGIDGIVREKDVEPESPSKKTHPSPRKETPESIATPSFGGFTAFANKNPFQAVSKTGSSGFAAFASGGFGMKSTTSSFGSGFGSTGFGASNTTTNNTKPVEVEKDSQESVGTAWTESNDNNDEFLNTEADKVEIQNLVLPKIDLPRDYHHQTGEENEDVLIQLTAKLYKLVDKEYVECGAGPLKVLEPKDKSSCGRVVMRRATSDFKAGTHLLLNALISSIPNVIAKGKSIIATILVDANTFTTYCIRLESAELAEKLSELMKK